MMTYYVSPRHLARRFAQLSDRQRSEVYIPVDVTENEDGYELTAYVPGVSAEDVTIEVLEDVISIRGEFPVSEDENVKYLLRERPSGSFSRSLRLPTELAASKAEAEVINGVLTVRVPKAEEAKAKLIKVKAK